MTDTFRRELDILIDALVADIGRDFEEHGIAYGVDLINARHGIPLEGPDQERRYAAVCLFWLNEGDFVPHEIRRVSTP